MEIHQEWTRGGPRQVQEDPGPGSNLHCPAVHQKQDQRISPEDKLEVKVPASGDTRTIRSEMLNFGWKSCQSQSSTLKEIKTLIVASLWPPAIQSFE